MDQNPYEPPKSDIVAGAFSSGSGLAAGQALPPDIEAKAMELLGRKRSKASGISFAVAWAVCTPMLLLVTGLLLALIIGGALAGAISKFYVKSSTQAFVDQVSRELGIPPGAFRPERYLI